MSSESPEKRFIYLADGSEDGLHESVVKGKEKQPEFGACYDHDDVPAVAVCAICGRFLCPDCHYHFFDQSLCGSCAIQLAEEAMKHKNMILGEEAVLFQDRQFIARYDQVEILKSLVFWDQAITFAGVGLLFFGSWGIFFNNPWVLGVGVIFLLDFLRRLRKRRILLMAAGKSYAALVPENGPNIRALRHRLTQ